MSVKVKSGKAQCEHMFSALPPTTDITKHERHVEKCRCHERQERGNIVGN